MVTEKCQQCQGTGKVLKLPGAQMRQLREAKGITQRDMALRLALDVTYLSRLENDQPNHAWTARRIKAYRAALRTD